MKIAIIGGGSSYTPELVEGLIRHGSTLPVTELVLIDVEEGLWKLKINEALAKRMFEHAGMPVVVRHTLDRREGLSNAAFVVNQIRVGGLDARIKDEKIPLSYGIIGQETTGPGGFFKALRTIPVVLDICHDMEEVCKDGWLINFTNPSGIVTEAVLKHTHVKCIGLCNVPINMCHDAAMRLNVPADTLDCRFIGLNHLSIMTHAIYQGVNRIQDVLDVSNSQSVVKNIEKNEEMDALAQKMGYMFSPYLQYFYCEKEMFARELKEALGGMGCRGEQVKLVEKELFDCYQNPKLNEKPASLSKRGGSRYSEAAINLIDSIYNDRGDVQVVDIRNNGTIPQLLDDVVIETNCTIDARGAVPLQAEPVPITFLGLVEQVKAYEILTIEAAVTGSEIKALQALLNHPLVHDVKDARSMFGEMLLAHKEYLPNFF